MPHLVIKLTPALPMKTKQRRYILRPVVEFSQFSVCLVAKGKSA